MDHVDTCVVGGGVIGLAIGRALSKVSTELLVLEQADDFGQGVSSRDSEVIHAGIYYPKDSLKSVFCRKGKWLLYDYCEKRNIPSRQSILPRNSGVRWNGSYCISSGDFARPARLPRKSRPRKTNLRFGQGKPSNFRENLTTSFDSCARWEIASGRSPPPRHRWKSRSNSFSHPVKTHG